MRNNIVYRRHIVDPMPIDGWNDVWRKLHQQIVNVDVLDVNSVPAEVYSTVATAVVWSMRLAFAVVFYLWIDSKMRPIYTKLIPCDLGTPSKKQSLPLKDQSLGSLGKSRWVHCDFFPPFILFKVFVTPICTSSLCLLLTSNKPCWFLR